MNMYATIEPVQYRTGEATSLIVRGVSVHLGDSANVDWILTGCHEGIPRKEFERGTRLLEGDDYTAWSNDDQYVLNWLCNQLNLTLISIEIED